MSAAGEPVKGRHGVILYSAQVSQGTAVTPATAAGMGSFEFRESAGIVPVFGLGTPNALFLKPGLNQTSFSIHIAAMQSSALAIKAKRASGTLPWVTLGLGKTFDDASNDAKQIRDCKIHSIDFESEASGMLRCSMSGVGGLVTTITTLAAANLSPTPMMWYEGVVLKGGSAYATCRSFRMNVNHNVSVQTCLPGTAPSTYKRGWSYQTEGNETIAGEIVRYAKSGVSMSADTYTDFALAFTFTDIQGGMSPNTITLTATNCEFGEEAESVSPEGDYLFTTPFVARSWSIA